MRQDDTYNTLIKQSPRSKYLNLAFLDFAELMMIEDIIVDGDFSKKPGEFKPNENQFHLCFQYSKVLEPKYLS